MTRNSSRVLPPKDAPKPKIKKRKLIPGRVRAAQRHSKKPELGPVFPDGAPEDMDAFREALAQRINMIVANRKEYWRSCREPSCRRKRACLAPHIDCSNAPPLPPDPDGSRTTHAVAMFRRDFEAIGARLDDVEDKLSPPHPETRGPRSDKLRRRC